MQKYDRPLGAFMNLESTGPGGPDYVFQQTGKRAMPLSTCCLERTHAGRANDRACCAWLPQKH